jgi:hypothetical protein
MSLVEIAGQLALPKTTVYYWITDLPLGRARRHSTGPRKGNRRMCSNYQRLRDEAYAQGVAQYEELSKIATFRKQRKAQWSSLAISSRRLGDEDI